MRERYDVVVIGAGLAGSLAARSVALAGHSVLLVERQRFPRVKVCGCCLNANALATLEQAGLGDLPTRLGARPLERVTLHRGGRTADLPLPPGVSLSRTALDAELFMAARSAGAETIEGCSAKVRSLGTSAEQGHTVTLSLGEQVTARCVLVADGLGGTSLRGLPGFGVEVQPGSRLGIGGVTEPQSSGRYPGEGTIAMACGRSGYLGAVRLEDGRIDFAAAIDADTLKRAGGVFEAASEIAEEATPALTRRRRRLAAPGLFVIGDAAGYVEPFTGEGMAWALAGGAAVAPLAIAASRQWDPQHPPLWADRHRRAVRRRQLGCRAVAATLRRPRLTAAVVRTLAACPPLVRPLTARLNRPSSVMVRSSSTRPAVQDVPLSGAA